MFCHKCGTQIAEGAVFCHRCGTKVVNAETAPQPADAHVLTHEPAANSNPEAAASVNPVQQVPPERNNVQSGKAADEKTKSAVILSIIAAIFLLFIIRGVTDKRSNSENDKVSRPSAIVTDVDLSKSYSNNKEGISFQYPSGWTPLSRKEIASYIRYEEADNVLSVIVDENETEDDLSICLFKIPATHDKKGLIFGDDGQFAEEFAADKSIDISAVNTSITTLDGVTAREIEYVDSDGYGHQRYLYVVGITIYGVEFSWLGESAGSNQRLFDAIIDSYSITADTAYTDKPETGISSKGTEGLCYKGIPVDRLLGKSPAEIISLLGEPEPSILDVFVYGDTSMSFDSWSLPEPYLTYIYDYGGTFEGYTYNGQPFTDDEQRIIEIMGREPEASGSSYSGTEYGVYSLSYSLDCSGSTVYLDFLFPADEYSTQPPGINIYWFNPDVPDEGIPGVDFPAED